jgi:hypothetical protein
MYVKVVLKKDVVMVLWLRLYSFSISIFLQRSPIIGLFDMCCVTFGTFMSKFSVCFPVFLFVLSSVPPKY